MAPSTPLTQAQADERRELFRLAGVNALARSRGGRDLSPEARADALRWAAYPPLNRPLTTGEPAGIDSTASTPHWQFAPLTTQQQQRHAAQAQALRAGSAARWPAGCTHLPGVPA